VGSSTDYLFFADEAGSWQVGRWASDARFLFCSTSSRTDLCRFVICDGSYFEMDGRRILTSKVPVVRDEWLNDVQASSLAQNEMAAFQLR
jgi:hypothetical protein